MLSLFIVVFLMLVASAICSGSEAAIFSLSESKVRALAENGSKSGKRLLKIIDAKDSYISTIVLLNNAINIMGSMFIGTLAAKELGASWLAAFSVGLTIAIIIFAEIIPKAIAIRKSLPITSFMGGPLYLFTFIFSPLVRLIDYISQFVIRLVIGENLAYDVAEEAEIKFLASQGAESRYSDVRQNEAETIKKVFDLHETKAKDIMTPRTVMTYVKGNSTVESNEKLISDTEHSRIIVIGETIDKLKGVILRVDLLISLKDSNGNIIINEHPKLDTNPLFFGEETRAEAMMVQFKKASKHLAIIKDSFGGISGIVTFEDVLEILVGEIKDETDTVEDLQGHAKTMARIDNNKAV